MDLVEIFTYNVKRAILHDLGFDTLKTLLLKSIRDECIYLINMMGKGDVSQLSFQDIFLLCKHISRGKSKYGRSPRDPLILRVSKFQSRRVGREELGNFLNKFKTNIFVNLSEQIDILRS